ncbi:unnamed protein product [Arabis nemorensis]|uniref:Uncharacterized protein n=1 Tax=Arabis nemorensis TaxID=586526 RepID=A0A565CUG6_9BRAS|nr:unnamed protein product [Arabis nemorensis]
MTGGGVYYSFVCVGLNSSISVVSTRTGTGKTVVLGIDKYLAPTSLDSFDLFRGKSVCGGLFGGLKPKLDIPILLDHYLKKELNLDSFITHKLKFEQINNAFNIGVFFEKYTD